MAWTETTFTFWIFGDDNNWYKVFQRTDFTKITMMAGTFDVPGKEWYVTDGGDQVFPLADGRFYIQNLNVIGEWAEREQIKPTTPRPFMGFKERR